MSRRDDSIPLENTAAAADGSGAPAPAPSSSQEAVQNLVLLALDDARLYLKNVSPPLKFDGDPKKSVTEQFDSLVEDAKTIKSVPRRDRIFAACKITMCIEKLESLKGSDSTVEYSNQLAMLSIFREICEAESTEKFSFCDGFQKGFDALDPSLSATGVFSKNVVEAVRDILVEVEDNNSRYEWRYKKDVFSAEKGMQVSGEKTYEMLLNRGTEKKPYLMVRPEFGLLPTEPIPKERNAAEVTRAWNAVRDPETKPPKISFRHDPVAVIQDVISSIEIVRKKIIVILGKYTALIIQLNNFQSETMKNHDLPAEAKQDVINAKHKELAEKMEEGALQGKDAVEALLSNVGSAFKVLESIEMDTEEMQETLQTVHDLADEVSKALETLADKNLRDHAVSEATLDLEGAEKAFGDAVETLKAETAALRDAVYPDDPVLARTSREFHEAEATKIQHAWRRHRPAAVEEGFDGEPSGVASDVHVEGEVRSVSRTPAQAGQTEAAVAAAEGEGMVVKPPTA